MFFTVILPLRLLLPLPPTPPHHQAGQGPLSCTFSNISSTDIHRCLDIRPDTLRCQNLCIVYCTTLGTATYRRLGPARLAHADQTSCQKGSFCLDALLEGHIA